jgi:hypothetical protein
MKHLVGARATVARILVATALALASVAAGYLYLRGLYVTDTALAEARIPEVTSQRGFDLEGARKSGYTDLEIATFLVKRNEAEFADRWRTLLVAVGAIYGVIVLGILASAMVVRNDPPRVER